jgi:hypothetical protein
MKQWHYEMFCESAAAVRSGALGDWPELSEALLANGLPLPSHTRMKAVREICRLILAEQEAIAARATSDQPN